MIYAFCLDVNLEIIPHPMGATEREMEQRQSELPSTSLLGVCKQIRAEARPILYGRNLWRLPRFPFENDLFHIVEPWLFTKVVLALTGNDAPNADIMSTACDVSLIPDALLSDPGTILTEADKAQERAELVHHYIREQVVEAWDKKITQLGKYIFECLLRIMVITLCL